MTWQGKMGQFQQPSSISSVAVFVFYRFVFGLKTLTTTPLKFSAEGRAAGTTAARRGTESAYGSCRQNQAREGGAAALRPSDRFH